MLQFSNASIEEGSLKHLHAHGVTLAVATSAAFPGDGDGALAVDTRHLSLFVSLVYCAESTVRWFIVRKKHCWMAADYADKSKRTVRLPVVYRSIGPWIPRIHPDLYVPTSRMHLIPVRVLHLSMNLKTI
jgi:hypothetical protein